PPLHSFPTRRSSDLLHNTVRGHKFAVQVVTECSDFGGYSGADFDQAQSFGRLAKNARSVTVRCDATIAMPMLVTSLSQTASKARSEEHTSELQSRSD